MWTKILQGEGPGPHNVLMKGETGELVVTTSRIWNNINRKQLTRERGKGMPAKAKGMGFFDQYKDIAQGGSFVSGDDKLFMIQQGMVFTIKALQFDPENQHGERWIAFCEVPNFETGEKEERKMGFPVNTNVPTRDHMLTQMKDYFDDEGEPVDVKLIKPNRAILIVNADA